MKWYILFVLLLAACSAGVSDSRVEQFLDIYPDAERTSETYTQSDAAFAQEFFSRECAEKPPYKRITYQQYGAKLTLYEKNGEVVCAVSKIEPGTIAVEQGVDGPENVALEVNGEPIMFDQVAALYATLSPEQQTIQNLNAIVNQLITQELLRQEAAEYSVDVQAAYDALVEQVGSEETLLEQLAAQNVTQEQLLEQLTAQLKLDALVADKLGEVAVTDEEVEEFYLANTNAFIVSEQASFQQVFISYEGRNADQLQLRLDTVVRSLNNTDFCTVVKQYSDDTASIEECGMYTIPRGVVQPDIEQAVFSAEPGVLTLVQSPTGLHVINVLERQPTQVIDYAAAQTEVKQFMQGQVQQLRLNAYVSTLRQNAQVVSYLNTQ